MAKDLTKRKPKKEPTEIHKKIGEEIRDRRLASDMTQVAFAKFLGVTFQQVQKYERGKDRIQTDQLIKIAKKLKFDLGEFLESLKGERTGLADQNTIDLVRIYKKLDKEDQKMVFSTVAVIANNKDY